MVKTEKLHFQNSMKIHLGVFEASKCLIFWIFLNVNSFLDIKSTYVWYLFFYFSKSLSAETTVKHKCNDRPRWDGDPDIRCMFLGGSRGIWCRHFCPSQLRVSSDSQGLLSSCSRKAATFREVSSTYLEQTSYQHSTVCTCVWVCVCMHFGMRECTQYLSSRLWTTFMTRVLSEQ